MQDIENYWSDELGEDVRILPVGWAEYPSEWSLYISGTHVVAFKKLEEIEDYLSRYFCVRDA